MVGSIIMVLRSGDGSNAVDGGLMVPCFPVTCALPGVLIHVLVDCLLNLVSLTRTRTSLRESSYQAGLLGPEVPCCNQNYSPVIG